MGCTLCNTQTADKKNSHIIPFSLLKSMVTPNESRRSEQDIAFNLSNSAYIDYYLGRDVRPEKINEILGRSMSEQEINDNNNPFTFDNIFCSTCEDKFARIESLFSNLILPVLKKSSISTSEKLDEKNSLIAKLFFYSIIWRLGIVGFNNYKINQSILSKLHTILNTCLSVDEKIIISNLFKNKQLIDRYKVAVCYFENSSIPDSQFVFIDSTRTRPHCYFINGLSLFFYYKSTVLKKGGNSFFGIEKSINKSEILKSNQIIIFRNTDLQIMKGVHQMIEIIAQKKINELKNTFIDLYFQKNDKSPSSQIITRYMNDLLDVDYNNLDKFSLQRVAKFIYKYIYNL